MIVSMIMPVYNAEKFLKRTLNSVLKQSFSDFELLCIDDGSMDQSFEICMSYATKDNRIKCFKKENSGPSDTRNFGLKLCTGDYVSFIDSDDEIKPNYLLDFMHEMSKMDFDFVCCNLERSSSAKITSTKFEAVYLNKNEINGSIESIFKSGVFNSPVNKLYRRSILVKNNIFFDTRLNMGEDFSFNLDFLTFCDKISFLKASNYIYHIQDQSLTFQYRDNELENRKINIDKVISYFNLNSIHSSFSDEMKIKLIYASAIQDILFSKPQHTFEEISTNQYFKNLKPSSNIMKFLYQCSHSAFTFNLISYLMYLVKYKFKFHWKGASL